MKMLSPLSTEFAWPRRTLSPAGMESLFEEFDRMMDGLFNPQYVNGSNFLPSCDVSETKDNFLISFDIPGVKKENIQIQVQDGELVMTGERSGGHHEKEGQKTLRFERSYGKFERRFKLPQMVVADKIEAHYDDGVLNLVLPKAESSKGRTIEIQSGQGGFMSRLLGSKKDSGKDLKDVKVS